MKKFTEVTTTVQSLINYCPDDVIVRVITLSILNDGFDPLSSQTDDHENGICCFYTMNTA